MSMSVLGKEEDHEKEWMMRVNSILHAELEMETLPIMWSSYHACRSDGIGKCIEALLSLFRDKAASPGMIRHGMGLVKKITEYLNPQQIPVLVVDQPLFAIQKQCSGPSQRSLEKIGFWYC